MMTEPQHKPRVSVVIPAYNVAGYIRATIDSMLNQTLSDIEIIVIDDCSTDDTIDVVAAYDDPRIVLLRQPTNQGPSAARAVGFARARADYVAVIDADDIAFPTRLQEQAAMLDSDPALGMVGSQIELMHENGEPTGYISPRPVAPADAAIGMLFRNSFSSVLMLRKTYIPTEPSRYALAEDYDFNVRVADRAKVMNLDRPLTYVRRRTGGLTQSKTELMFACIKEVMRDQLRKLGIEPTPRELDINRHIGAKTLPNSVELVREIEQWLLRLQTANAATGRYPHDDFLRNMSAEWFDVCRFAASLGPRAMLIWYRSPLNQRHWQPGPKKLLKFFIRSLLRHKQVGYDVPSPPPVADATSSKT